MVRKHLNQQNHLATTTITFYIIAIFVVLLIQAILLPIWHDEAITILEIAGNPRGIWPPGLTTLGELKQSISQSSSFKEISDSLIETDVHPPLYYYIVKIVADIFGNHVIVARSIALISTLASIAIILVSIKRYVPNGIYVAYIIIPTSPTLLYASIYARDYGLALLLVSAAIYTTMILTSYTSIDRRKSYQLSFTIAALSSLAFATHYFTISITLPLNIIVLCSLFKRHPGVIVMQCLIAILVLLLISPYLSTQFSARPDQYAGSSSLMMEFLHLSAGYLGQISMPKIGSTAIYLLSSCIPILLAWQIIKHIKSPEITHQFAISIILIISSFVTILVIFVATDKTLAIEAARYSMFAIMPLIFILASIGSIFRNKIERIVQLDGPINRLFKSAPIIGLATLSVASVTTSHSLWKETAPYKSYQNVMADIDNNNVLMVFTQLSRGITGSVIHNFSDDYRAYVYSDDIDEIGVRAYLGGADAVVFFPSSSKAFEVDGSLKQHLHDSGLSPLSDSLWIMAR